jgi:hypothetical protein
VSNGEWCPLPITDRQRRLARLIVDETTQRANWHGMTRGQFLRTAAATMTAFMCINKVYGYDQNGDNAMLPVRREHCDDLDAAREVLDRKKWFIMDVQHHLDLTSGNTDFSASRLHQGIACREHRTDGHIRQVFVNSETTVGVISGLPDGVPLGPAAMVATRDLVNRLAGSERALSQAVCDPKSLPGEPTAIDQMEHQVTQLRVARSSATPTATSAGGSTTNTAPRCSRRRRASASRS